MVKKNYEVLRHKDRAFGGFMLHPTCVIFLADVPTSRCVKLLVVFCLKPSKLFVSILEVLENGFSDLKKVCGLWINKA